MRQCVMPGAFETQGGLVKGEAGDWHIWQSALRMGAQNNRSGGYAQFLRGGNEAAKARGTFEGAKRVQVRPFRAGRRDCHQSGLVFLRENNSKTDLRKPPSFVQGC